MIQAMLDLLVTTGFALLISPSLRWDQLLLAVQAGTIALLVVSVQAAQPLEALVMFLLKGLVIPLMLGWFFPRGKRLAHDVPRTWTWFVGAVLLVWSQVGSGSFARGLALQDAYLLGAALTLFMFALTGLLVRVLTFHHLVFLVVLENSFLLAVAAVAHGLPVVLDMGANLALVSLSLLLLWLQGRLLPLFNSSDIRLLRHLRG